jgi:transposase
MSAVLAEVAAPAPTLDVLARRVRQEHMLVLEAGSMVIRHAVAAGEALLAAKAQVEYGQWEGWLAENFPEANPSTPRAYMRLARYADQLVDAQPTTIRGALRTLADAEAPDTRRNPIVVAEARKLKLAGYTVQQVAEEIGVSKSTAYWWLNPSKEKAKRAKEKSQGMAARRALNRRKRDAQVKKAGGSVAEAYSLVRKALRELEDAIGVEENREAKRAMQQAMDRLYRAEDMIVKAVGLK